MTLATRVTEPYPRKPQRSLWPIAIIVWFILFAAAMTTWIVYASSQKMELVGEDYYDKEIRYQREIDAASRAQRVGAGVKVAYDFAQQTITVQVPATHQQANAKGEIRFYRPNDARLDHTVPLSVGGEGMQQLDARKLAPGLWKVRLSWNVNGEEFFFDQSLVVGSNS